jgi:hypothetical protein
MQHSDRKPWELVPGMTLAQELGVRQAWLAQLRAEEREALRQARRLARRHAAPPRPRVRSQLRSGRPGPRRRCRRAVRLVRGRAGAGEPDHDQQPDVLTDGLPVLGQWLRSGYLAELSRAKREARAW